MVAENTKDVDAAPVEVKSREVEISKKNPKISEVVFGKHGSFQKHLENEGYFKTLFSLLKLSYVLPILGLTWVIKQFRKWGWIGFILFVVILISFYYLWFGSLLNVTVVPLYTGVIDPALESVMPGFKGTLSKAWNVFLDPESARDEFDPSAAKQVSTEQKGVIFSAAKENRDYYIESEKVDISTRVQIYGLKESPTNVEFSCSDVVEDNYFSDDDVVEGKAIVSGSDTSTVNVPPDVVKPYFVTCTYENGFKIEDRREIKKAKFKAKYSNFKTKGELNVYTLSKTRLLELETAGINPFDDVDYDTYLNKKDRSVRPIYGEGPVNLEIDLPASQPLTDGAPYRFFIKIKPKTYSWSGELVEIKTLSLKLPSSFNLVTDTESKCDFNEKGDLKVEVFDRINLRFNEDQQELSKQSGDVSLVCSFNVDDVTDVVKMDVIKVELIYDYVFTKTTTFEINKAIVG